MQRRTGLIFLLAALAALSWWLAQTQEDTALTPSFRNASDVDAYLKDLHAITLQADGQPARVLMADEVRHLSTSGSKELTRPVLLIYQENTPPWRITSETGEVSPNGDWVFLNGAVEIIREAANGVRPVRLQTRNMRVRPEQAYVETEEFVKMYSKRDWVQAMGMRAWLHEPVNIQLLQKVKSFYAPPG